MTTTLKAIADILGFWDIGYYTDSTERFLRLETKSLSHTKALPILIGPIQNGQIVHIDAPIIFQLNDKVFKAVFFKKLLELQNSISLINFYFNTHQNGEEWVGASIDMPLFERELTYQNLFACMTHLNSHLKEIIPRFQHILATGCEPE